MDANEPLEFFTNSDSKLSFDQSAKIGPLQLSSPMEQIKLIFDVSSKNLPMRLCWISRQVSGIGQLFDVHENSKHVFSKN